MLRWAALALALGASACNQSTPAPSPTAPADCAKVGELVASLQLGVTGKPEARAPIVATYRERCTTAKLTAGEATCMARATSTWAAMDCAPRMFPERTGTTPTGEAVAAEANDCKQVAARLRSTIVAGLPKDAGSAATAMVDTMVGVIETSCRVDDWPADYRSCVTATRPGEETELNACEGKLPTSLRTKMAERMRPIIQATTTDK